ncbi:MAG: helix-turn-helix domain-containing protein [Gammaproteobacteria bacterium]|nr:helix-turn-helix domain-containing protein [Gammaproteobacteria bacterium]
MDEKLFQELTQSIRQAGDYLHGEGKASRTFTIDVPDVKAVRNKTGLSQSQFALLVGVKLKTLQNWEQKRRHPTGPAAVLLRIVEKEPDAALRALRP